MRQPMKAPEIKNMNQLETAIHLEKYMIILAMLNFGTKEERKVAKQKFKEMNLLLDAAVSKETFIVAEGNLDLSEEEIHAIQQTA